MRSFVVGCRSQTSEVEEKYAQAGSWKREGEKKEWKATSVNGQEKNRKESKGRGDTGLNEVM